MLKKVFFAIVLISFLCIGGASSEQFDQFTEISFEWDSNIEPDLAGYRIYKSDTTGVYNFVEANAIAVIPAGTTTAGPFVFDVGTWYFVCTAVDTAGNESGPSNEVTATFIDTPPAAPTGCVLFKVRD